MGRTKLQKLTIDRSGRLRLSEADVTKQIIDFLRASGWTCIRLQSGLFQRPGGRSRTRVGEPGLPDYVAIRSPTPLGFKLWAYVFFLEFKSSTGKLSTDQISWHKNAAENGLTVYVANEFDAFKSWFEARYGR